MKRWIFGGLCLLMLAGCASEATRYRMPSAEGQYQYIDETKKPADQTLALISDWVDATFNQRKIQKTLDPAGASVQVKAWAGVTVYGQEQLVEYQMTCRVKDKKYRLQFVAGAMPNGFYPSRSNLSQLESYFGSLRESLKKYIEQPPAF